MSKRKINRRQAWRIEKIQQERIARAQRRSEQADASLSGGELGAEIEGRVVAHFGTQIAVEHLQGPSKGQVHRCHVRANVPALVTGDRVVWCPGESLGVVVAQLSRDSVLKRPDRHGILKPVAANIDVVVIVIAVAPQAHAQLIDRYLAAVEHTGIQPVLLLNKTDLINTDNEAENEDLLQPYIDIGYRVWRASTQSAHGLDELRAALATRTSVFVGQSGVGKSSLVNALLPQANMRVGELSAGKQKGTHTTTTAQLFHFPDGGQLIDSPGIRDFALTHIERDELEHCFIEFRPYLGQCRFRDCQHESEPGCALLQAVDAGKIHRRRFDSYRHIINAN